jgi:hypothetical protein
MKRFRAFTAGLVIGLTSVIVAPSTASAEGGCQCDWCTRRPYGRSAPGDGGRYGAKAPVKTAEEARKRLEAYYDDEDLVVGKVSEKPLYFEASVKHKDGRLVDRVIIDKRSGRIRSIL